MMNSMSRYNITWFDTETTGLDIKSIGLVSIYAVNYKLKTTIDTLVNPQVPIPDEAFNVHGINKKDVKGKPKFKKLTGSISNLFENSEYIGGYNICKYDVPLINSLFERNGSNLNIKHVKYIDMFYIAKNVLPQGDLNALERVNLVSVYNLVTGKVLDAHKAKYDTLACVEMLEIFEESGLPWRDYLLSWEDLSGVEINNVDYTVKFGKHCGKSINYLIENESNYLKWAINNNVLILSNELNNLLNERRF